MKNRVKTPQCGKCRNFCRDKNYLYQGVCAKDDEVVREHRTCEKLLTDRDRQIAKQVI
jgi:hypothetical protein